MGFIFNKDTEKNVQALLNTIQIEEATSNLYNNVGSNLFFNDSNSIIELTDKQKQNINNYLKIMTKSEKISRQENLENNIRIFLNTMLNDPKFHLKLFNPRELLDNVIADIRSLPISRETLLYSMILENFIIKFKQNIINLRENNVKWFHQLRVGDKQGYEHLTIELTNLATKNSYSKVLLFFSRYYQLLFMFRILLFTIIQVKINIDASLYDQYGLTEDMIQYADIKWTALDEQFIIGPLARTDSTFDPKEYYEQIVNPSDYSRSVNELISTANQNSIIKNTGNIVDVIKARKNSYFKLTNYAEEFILGLNSKNNCEIIKDSDNNLEFKFTDVHVSGDTKLNDAIVISPIGYNTIGRYNIGHINELFSKYQKIKLIKFRVSKTVFKSLLTKDQLYIALSGIQTSINYSNNAVENNNILIWKGMFTEDGDFYNFNPIYDFCTYLNLNIRIEYLGFYVSNNPSGKNSLISRYASYNITTDNIFNINCIIPIKSNLTTKSNSFSYNNSFIKVNLKNYDLSTDTINDTIIPINYVYLRDKIYSTNPKGILNKYLYNNWPSNGEKILYKVYSLLLTAYSNNEFILNILHDYNIKLYLNKNTITINNSQWTYNINKYSLSTNNINNFQSENNNMISFNITGKYLNNTYKPLTTIYSDLELNGTITIDNNNILFTSPTISCNILYIQTSEQLLNNIYNFTGKLYTNGYIIGVINNNIYLSGTSSNIQQKIEIGPINTYYSTNLFIKFDPEIVLNIDDKQLNISGYNKTSNIIVNGPTTINNLPDGDITDIWTKKTTETIKLVRSIVINNTSLDNLPNTKIVKLTIYDSLNNELNTTSISYGTNEAPAVENILTWEESVSLIEEYTLGSILSPSNIPNKTPVILQYIYSGIIQNSNIIKYTYTLEYVTNPDIEPNISETEIIPMNIFTQNSSTEYIYTINNNPYYNFPITLSIYLNIPINKINNDNTINIFDINIEKKLNNYSITGSYPIISNEQLLLSSLNNLNSSNEYVKYTFINEYYPSLKTLNINWYYAIDSIYNMKDLYFNETEILLDNFNRSKQYIILYNELIAASIIIQNNIVDKEITQYNIYNLEIGSNTELKNNNLSFKIQTNTQIDLNQITSLTGTIMYENDNHYYFYYEINNYYYKALIIGLTENISFITDQTYILQINNSVTYNNINIDDTIDQIQTTISTNEQNIILQNDNYQYTYNVTVFNVSLPKFYYSYIIPLNYYIQSIKNIIPNNPDIYYNNPLVDIQINELNIDYNINTNIITFTELNNINNILNINIYNDRVINPEYALKIIDPNASIHIQNQLKYQNQELEKLNSINEDNKLFNQYLSIYNSYVDITNKYINRYNEALISVNEYIDNQNSVMNILSIINASTHYKNNWLIDPYIGSHLEIVNMSIIADGQEFKVNTSNGYTFPDFYEKQKDYPMMFYYKDIDISTNKCFITDKDAIKNTSQNISSIYDNEFYIVNNNKSLISVINKTNMPIETEYLTITTNVYALEAWFSLS